MANKLERIVKKHLIFCEGVDEKFFLIHYLNSKEMQDDPFFAEEIQIIDFGGNEELETKLKTLALSSGFTSVKSLLVIRDAETDGNRAITQIQTSLKNTGFPVPNGPGEWQVEENVKQKIAFLLFPTCDESVKNGTLEDLCLSILKQPDGSDMLKEIQMFFLSLTEKYQREFPHEHKAKLHTYFSITDKFVGMKIGEAAKANAFDWNSEKLRFLKNFLLSMKDKI